ncbi:ARGOS-like protein [Nicotiana sylvestris]|uniref:ARGOS-like protein n=1 Tax=Nicotiana sylvestris TaxID=4096 RepID=UPI00388CEAC2
MNNNSASAAFPRKNISFVEGKKLAEYKRSLSSQKVLSISYFSLESFVLLLCLTASLLLLPLILPPLPPPPFMLLLLPILILLLLMFLAFMPNSSNLRNVSYTYVSSP